MWRRPGTYVFLGCVALLVCLAYMLWPGGLQSASASKHFHGSRPHSRLGIHHRPKTRKLKPAKEKKRLWDKKTPAKDNERWRDRKGGERYQSTGPMFSPVDKLQQQVIETGFKPRGAGKDKKVFQGGQMRDMVAPEGNVFKLPQSGVAKDKKWFQGEQKGNMMAPEGNVRKRPGAGKHKKGFQGGNMENVPAGKFDVGVTKSRKNQGFGQLGPVGSSKAWETNKPQLKDFLFEKSRQFNAKNGSSKTEKKLLFRDHRLPWADRVEDLVGRLRPKEVIPQTIAFYDKATPAIKRLGIKPYQWITECLHGQMRTTGTAFPQALGLAATFSHKLIYRVAEAISMEVRGNWNKDASEGQPHRAFRGLTCFSPVINIMRHPLWGRNQETYGEDPYLASELVKQYVRGLQGNHSRYVRVAAGCKHFDVHGGPENKPVNRHSFNAKVSMQDWQNTFLPAFKACVKAGSLGLMCSYNRINGTPACAHKELLTDIARKKWGFRGFVVSDGGAIKHMIYSHKYAKSQKDAATKAIKAGCNLELSFAQSAAFQAQSKALHDGSLTEEDIRNNSKPLFYTRMRLGEFDPVDFNPYNEINASKVVQSVKHRELALEAAVKSFVLLKNYNHTLPLKKRVEKLVVVGPFAEATQGLYGNFAPSVNEAYATSPLHGLKDLAADPTSVKSVSGCFNAACLETSYTQERPKVQKAVVDADVVIVCLGLGRSYESEGNDRTGLKIPGSQMKLLKDVTIFNNRAKVILLLFNAGPVDVEWAKTSPRVAAIMACFYPAQATGTALYTVLAGWGNVTSPAGRLPATWPADMDQVPPMIDYSMKGRTYRYFNGDPLYPFGYGLSYTKFEYTQLTVEPQTVQLGKAVNVTVTVLVTNTGKFPSDEVTQVYISWPKETTVIAPKLQLVSFKRAHYEVGAFRTLSFKITDKQLAVWTDQRDSFKIPTGKYTVHVGGQQPARATRAPSNVLRSSLTVSPGGV